MHLGFAFSHLHLHNALAISSKKAMRNICWAPTCNLFYIEILHVTNVVLIKNAHFYCRLLKLISYK